MADILIRGMEMPEMCGVCLICLDDSRICNGYCMIYHRKVNMYERDKACPLVPLPEGHGRLGDLDALEEKLRAEALLHTSIGDLNRMTLGGGEVIDRIKAAPTIIEAEGGGE